MGDNINTQIVEYGDNERAELLGAVSVFLERCSDEQLHSLQRTFADLTEEHAVIPPKPINEQEFVGGLLEAVSRQMGAVWLEDHGDRLAPDRDFMERMAEHYERDDWHPGASNLATAAMRSAIEILWAHEEDQRAEPVAD